MAEVDILVDRRRVLLCNFGGPSWIYALRTTKKAVPLLVGCEADLEHHCAKAAHIRIGRRWSGLGASSFTPKASSPKYLLKRSSRPAVPPFPTLWHCRFRGEVLRLKGTTTHYPKGVRISRGEYFCHLSALLSSSLNASNAQFPNVRLNIRYHCQQDIFLVGKKCIPLNDLIHHCTQAGRKISWFHNGAPYVYNHQWWMIPSWY